METLINYLTDMLAHDKQVVSVKFVLEHLHDIRDDMRHTRYEPAYGVFKRKQDECIIEAGWRHREDARCMRLYEGGK